MPLPPTGSPPVPSRIDPPGRAIPTLLLSLTLTACAMQPTPAFDANAWKAQRGASTLDNRRNTMVAALEKTLRTGMSRDEVIALLGEPDIVDAEASTDTYELGAARFGVDEEYYEIRYEHGKVVAHHWGRR